MQVWKMLGKVDQLDGSGQTKVPKQKNTCKEGQHQVCVLTNASQLGHGHQNGDPNPSTLLGVDDALLVFWWSTWSLQVQCGLGDALRPDNRNHA
jgi:hypothetical protein